MDIVSGSRFTAFAVRESRLYMVLRHVESRSCLCVACRTVLYNAEGRTVCLVLEKPWFCHHFIHLVLSVF